MFKKIWIWLKKLFNAILDFFNPIKRPMVKITILMFLIVIPSFAQRTELQYLHGYFEQSFINNNDFWVVKWSNSIGTDSVIVYKTDTTILDIKNLDGIWESFSGQLSDTMDVRIKINVPHPYDIESLFTITAKTDIAFSMSDTTKTYFMVSDINHVSDTYSERGYFIGDQAIDGLDLLELARHFGESGKQYSDFEDINGDGFVDGLDLIILSRNWGRTWSP